MQSLLRTAITGARASSIPAFQPDATPRFSSKRWIRARIGGCGSGEPLSITTTSVGRRATSQTRSIVSAAIAASSGVLLQTGIVTVSAGLPSPLPRLAGGGTRGRSSRSCPPEGALGLGDPLVVVGGEGRPVAAMELGELGLVATAALERRLQLGDPGVQLGQAGLRPPPALGGAGDLQVLAQLRVVVQLGDRRLRAALRLLAGAEVLEGRSAST